MTSREFDAWCRSFLEIDACSSIDASLNGIQVDGDGSPLSRVAFAVDASLEAIRRAAALGANLLFVHHGLFWKGPSRIEGFMRERVKLLLDSNICLYACHLPLDKHPELGNNAGLARLLGLVDIEPFGLYHGVKIGLKGRFPEPVGLDAALRLLSPDGTPPSTLIPAGPGLCRSAALMSGGGASDVLSAIDEGIDLFVTGEAEHEIYYPVVESGINFAALGHYATETYGVRSVAGKLGRETGLETSFIDLPTGL